MAYYRIDWLSWKVPSCQGRGLENSSRSAVLKCVIMQIGLSVFLTAAREKLRYWDGNANNYNYILEEYLSDNCGEHLKRNKNEHELGLGANCSHRCSNAAIEISTQFLCSQKNVHPLSFYFFSSAYPVWDPLSNATKCSFIAFIGNTRTAHASKEVKGFPLCDIFTEL